VVTNEEELADAVLIRRIEPLDGMEIMKQRRGMESGKNLSNGPGKLSQALGIRTSMSGDSLMAPPVWIENRNVSVYEREIEATPRIGVDYAGDHSLREWRFLLER
jgi:DNA-3-methyladenine glycosylase